MIICYFSETLDIELVIVGQLFDLVITYVLLLILRASKTF